MASYDTNLLIEKRMDINSLPFETFAEILIKTDGLTLGKCRRVCKKWKESIDQMDYVWDRMCRKEYRNASWIARKKCGHDCSWYHLYKNLTMWKIARMCDNNMKEFYTFSSHDKSHALQIDYSVLPLKDTRGIVLYDMTTLKYMPVAVPEKDCQKIANNDCATVILLKSGILLQRTVDNLAFMTEAFFKADDFTLSGKELYFINNRDIYKCDLTEPNLESKLMYHCNYNIKQIQYNFGILCAFTDCGKIVSIDKDRSVSVKPVNCPPAWVQHIKHISAINDKNYICYSRHIFQIETDDYRHLYLDFPPITASFFYADFIIICTTAGEILLYRLSSQTYRSRPLFETIAQLPDGKIAVQLDVCERKTGPVIVVSTFSEIILLEFDFFPHENNHKNSFHTNKVLMYKRLLILRDRLRLGVPSMKAIA